MSKNLIRFLKLVVSIGLAAGLLYLVFRDMDWSDFWEKEAAVDYKWVAISILMSIIAYLARAYRWNILLKPLGYDLKTSRSTIAVIVGYLANLVLPRLGEITRCGVLKRNDGVPIPVAFGTVFIDRLVDLIMLFLLMGLCLIVEADILRKFLNEAYSDLKIPFWIPVTLILLAIGGIVVLLLIIKHQNKIKGKFGELLRGFISGIISLKDIKNPVGFIVSTIVLWVVYYFMSYVVVFSIPETSHLDLGGGLMLLITAGIALSLPVQSGFGTYHGMVTGMLFLYGVEKTTGLFLATLLHTSQIIAIAFFGTIALIISFLMKRNVNASETHETKNS